MKKDAILLVEDEQDILQSMYKSIISKSRDQFDVFLGVDGEEALKLMQDKHIDLLVLDLNMDNLTGLEVCQQMAMDNTLHKIKVIISSGYLDESMINQLKTLGVRHFLKKPYPMCDLINKINELMHHQYK